ncbi:MAG: biotin transporter BioY [Bdellovibrionales bacterium]
MASRALIPTWIDQQSFTTQSQRRIATASAWFMGALLLTALAQISIPLPWTPVPITGQTFGVALLALLWGRKLGAGIVGGYVLLGLTGLPILATAKLGPTSGYLVGMVLASYVVGGLADRGWTSTFPRALAAAYVGSTLIFGLGLLVLSYFVPSEALLGAGLFPFMPGDLIKNILAATIATGAARARP